MKTFPEIVTFRITSRCNNNCKYCFGPPKNLDEMDFLKLKELFRLFHKNGVKAVVLTGGEPLVREDFEDIIKELKKYNFKIFLDTNGDLFFKYSDLILNNVDVIGLPIDFPNKSYRNLDNLDTVLKILNFFKNKEKRPAIRVGTIVTKDNVKEIEKIGDLLKDYPIDIWKICEFIPQNVNAVKNKSLLEVSPLEFDDTTQKIKKRFSKYFKIAISKRKDRTNAYFFVASDGTVFMPVDDLNVCREIKLGNIFDKNIAVKWGKFVSENNYINNAKVTFNYKFSVPRKNP
jgi:molybdenum cofactor biosynthesis enzyme MoaA